MSWEISCTTYSINYVVDGVDDSFNTDSINRIDRKLYEVDGGGYKEPKDNVMVDTYSAESEHGFFTWIVTARRAGFDGYAHIENVASTEPENCEALDMPSFKIKEND